MLGAESIVVLVEDDGEVVGESVLHHPVQRLQPCGVEAVPIVHVAEGLQIDTNGLEPGVVDELEMTLVKSGFSEVVPQRIVADDVHSPAHFSDLRGGIDLRTLRAQAARNKRGKRKESRR